MMMVGCVCDTQPLSVPGGHIHIHMYHYVHIKHKSLVIYVAAGESAPFFGVSKIQPDVYIIVFASARAGEACIAPLR